MDMNQVIARINELARKKKSGIKLTEAELQEQQELRQVYLQSVRANLKSQLDSIVIEHPDGTREKLKPKNQK